MSACGTCDGKGELFAICIKRSDGPSGPGVMRCHNCKGTGQETRTPESIADGQRLREDRMARGLSLGEEARRRGIAVSALSDMEHGRSGAMR